MDIREQIVAEARSWLGTPYHHQQSTRGAGCDCVGLVRGVGVACGVMPPRLEEWARFAGYSRRPNPRRMAEGMHTFLMPLPDGAEPLPGDIAWLQWRANLPMHLALLAHDAAGAPQLIHSFSDAGQVVCHGLTLQWRERVVSWWRYPGVAE